MKKLLPLLLLGATCLASCGEDSPAGMYSFLLGRQGENETRVGLNIELKDDKYTIPEGSDVQYSPEEKKLIEERGKQFTLSLDLGSAFDQIMKALKLENGINGYYMLLDDVDEKYGRKMALGIDFEVREGIDLPITSELIKNLVVSYNGGGKITLQLPVSFEDLQYQLCWYSGAYFDFDPYIKSKIHDIEDIVTYFLDILETQKYYDLTKIADLPGPTGEKRFGSHPEIKLDENDNVTQDDIAAMNEKYAGVFSNTYIYACDSSGNMGEKIGSVYQTPYKDTVVENFYPLNGFTIPEEAFNAYVVVDNLLSTQNVKVRMQVYNKDGIDDHDIVYMKVDGNQGLYEDGENMKYKDYEKEAFTFRDFHDIKVQLSKD